MCHSRTDDSYRSGVVSYVPLDSRIFEISQPFFHSAGIQWNSYVHMCITTTKTRSLAAVWGAPIFFEVAVVASVFWNVISSPRSALIPLSKALQKDGITFFLVVVMLRLFNMVFAVIAGPSMTLFAVWWVNSFQKACTF